MSAAAQTTACGSHQTGDEAAGSAQRSFPSKHLWYCTRRNASLAGGTNQQDTRLNNTAATPNLERRTKGVRRTLALILPKASAQKFHQRQAVSITAKPSARYNPVRLGRLFDLGGLAPTASGANSVVSALGLRSGATPFGHVHTNIASWLRSAEPDISIWQKRGNFYLALTDRLIVLVPHSISELYSRQVHTTRRN